MKYEDMPAWAVQKINKFANNPVRSQEIYNDINKDIEDLGLEGAEEKWTRPVDLDKLIEKSEQEEIPEDSEDVVKKIEERTKEFAERHKTTNGAAE